MSSFLSGANLVKLGGTAVASIVGLYLLYRQVKSSGNAEGDLYINESELTK